MGRCDDSSLLRPGVRPTDYAVGPMTATMPTALITGVAGQDGMYLARLLLANGWRVVGTVGANQTTFTQDGLLAGKTYLYRVRAFNEAGVSAPSAADSVRTLPPSKSTALSNESLVRADAS